MIGECCLVNRAAPPDSATFAAARADLGQEKLINPDTPKLGRENGRASA